MAIWQFDVLLVPRGALRNTFGRVPEHVTEKALDATDWWGGYSLTEEDERLISSLAAPRQAWSRNIKAWGDEDGNRINIYREAERVVEVRARIDARSPDPTFLRGLVALANHWDCVLVTEDLQVIPSLASELEVAVKGSRAHRFITDPERYFDTEHPDTDDQP